MHHHHHHHGLGQAAAQAPAGPVAALPLPFSEKTTEAAVNFTGLALAGVAAYFLFFKKAPSAGLGTLKAKEKIDKNPNWWTGSAWVYLSPKELAKARKNKRAPQRTRHQWWDRRN